MKQAVDRSNRLQYFLYLFFALAALILSATTLTAQSIYFRPAADWKSVMNEAAKEGKLVFVDVYTDWCGPCKLMDAEVFTRADVANVYNKHFVSYKLDAEKGEGIELKKRYNVQVYPTYLFIDPNTEALVHKSTSRQVPDVFIQTGLAALNPDTRSVVLERQYASGKRTPSFLRAYAGYLHSIYQREKLDSLVRSYIKSATLADTLAWEFFVQYQQGTGAVEFQQLLQNRELFNKKYGEESVDKKIATAYWYDINRVISQGIYNASRFDEGAYSDLMASINKIQFEGKNLILYKANTLNQFRMGNYNVAADLADSFPQQPGVTPDEVFDFYKQLYFHSRSHTDINWVGRALTYARYVAMNDTEGRSKAEIHYNYARLLENYLMLLQQAGKAPEVKILKPLSYGETEYTLRSADLKPKPVRREK
ncbi:MAG TPA: thioredoxin family protein [Parasegetibacter sp.]